MDLATGTRTTAATAGVVLIGGLTVSIHGALNDDIPAALCGLAVTLVALTALVLTLIRGWVTDTRDERRTLAALQREAQTREATYIAAKAALENEQGRLAKDVAAERAALTARLKAERDALESEFEERRATLISETMTATFLMFHEGKFAPEDLRKGTVIRFPNQQLQPERQREHGGVRP